MDYCSDSSNYISKEISISIIPISPPFPAKPHIEKVFISYNSICHENKSPHYKIMLRTPPWVDLLFHWTSYFSVFQYTTMANDSGWNKKPKRTQIKTRVNDEILEKYSTEEKSHHHNFKNFGRLLEDCILNCITKPEKFSAVLYVDQNEMVASLDFKETRLAYRQVDLFKLDFKPSPWNMVVDDVENQFQKAKNQLLVTKNKYIHMLDVIARRNPSLLLALSESISMNDKNASIVDKSEKKNAPKKEYNLVDEDRNSRLKILGFNPNEGVGGVLGVFVGDCIMGSVENPRRCFASLQILNEKDFKYIRLGGVSGQGKTRRMAKLNFLERVMSVEQDIMGSIIFYETNGEKVAKQVRKKYSQLKGEMEYISDRTDKILNIARERDPSLFSHLRAMKQTTESNYDDANLNKSEILRVERSKVATKTNLKRSRVVKQRNSANAAEEDEFLIKFNDGILPSKIVTSKIPIQI
ncbi:hypothetical protein HK098_007647 [Nowakowskiella sp. JEL0407]|nr:hypothetical protein HK098_007647 [Nowakowskiella sp. JEL0407]